MAGPILKAESTDRTLAELGADLRRLRRRCQKLKRSGQGDTNGPAWARWSQAVDEQEAFFARIARIPIVTLEDVAVRYETVAMELIDGDLILDEAARRRVAALNRDLQQLARSEKAQSS